MISSLSISVSDNNCKIKLTTSSLTVDDTKPDLKKPLIPWLTGLFFNEDTQTLKIDLRTFVREDWMS